MVESGRKIASKDYKIYSLYIVSSDRKIAYIQMIVNIAYSDCKIVSPGSASA
jgi:hypothetical protein